LSIRNPEPGRLAMAKLEGAMVTEAVTSRCAKRLRRESNASRRATCDRRVDLDRLLRVTDVETLP
jgi:hypothetical protein